MAALLGLAGLTYAIKIARSEYMEQNKHVVEVMVKDCVDQTKKENKVPRIIVVGPPGVGKTTLVNHLTNQLTFELAPMKRAELLRIHLNPFSQTMRKTVVSNNPGSRSSPIHGTTSVNKLIINDHKEYEKMIIFDTPGMEFLHTALDEEKSEQELKKADLLIICVHLEMRFNISLLLHPDLPKNKLFVMTKTNEAIAAKGDDFNKLWCEMANSLGFNANNFSTLITANEFQKLISIDLIKNPIDMLTKMEVAMSNRYTNREAVDMIHKYHQYIWPDDGVDVMNSLLISGDYGSNLTNYFMKELKIIVKGLLWKDVYVEFKGTIILFTTLIDRWSDNKRQLIDALKIDLNS